MAFARRLQRVQHVGGSTPSGAPATPSPVTVTPGDASATLWWTFPANATGYDVQYRTHPSGSWQAWAYTGTITHTVITGLSNDTSYDFQVRSKNGLGTSAWSTTASVTPVATPATGGGLPATILTTLVNDSDTDTAYAYVTGIDPNTGKWAFVTADGQSLYIPPIPGANHTAIAQDCAIPLNAAGTAGKDITLPRLISGRVFFSYDAKMQFFIDTGGGLVMPSPLNPADENIDVQYTFCEFTFDNTQLYGNISFVDILSIPVAFKLTVSDGFGTQYVPGLPDNGMEAVANKLLAQKALDGTGWDKCLFYNSSNQLVRVLSPNSTVQPALYPHAFDGYMDSYVDAVWAKYSSQTLTVDTQYIWGQVSGQVSGGVLNLSGFTFAKPTSKDIFSCSTGPFTTGNDESGNISARLAAAFNRTTLLTNSVQPTNENPNDFYYTETKTNHYARIVHEEVYGNLGYAFPYDDVHPAGVDFEGRIQSGAPSHWTITVGKV